MRVVQKKINQANYYELLDLDSITVGNKVVFDIFIKKQNLQMMRCMKCTNIQSIALKSSNKMIL
jgi:hypothetical protein